MIKLIRLIAEIIAIFVIALLLSIVAEHSYITTNTNENIVYSVDGVYVCIPSDQKESFLQLNKNAVLVNQEDWLD